MSTGKGAAGGRRVKVLALPWDRSRKRREHPHRLKILEMQRKSDYGDDPVIPPVFNRPGMYMTAENCWVEYPGGYAYPLDRRLFRERMDSLVAAELTRDEVKALSAVCRTGLHTRLQKRLLHAAMDAVFVREVLREHRRRILRVMKDGFCTKNTKGTS